MPENNKRLARVAANHRVGYALGSGLFVFILVGVLAGLGHGWSFGLTLGAVTGVALAIFNLWMWRPSGHQARATREPGAPDR